MSRRGFWLLMVPCVLAVAFLTGLGLLVGLDGHAVGWTVAGLGGLLLVGAGLVLVNQRHPQARELAPAQADGPGVRLPLRRGFALRQGISAACLGGIALPGAALLDSALAWMVAVPVVAAGLAAGWWLAGPGADASRVRLDPEGITVPRGTGTTPRLAWREIRAVEVVDSWQPHLLMVGPEGRWAGMRLYPQGWPPETIEAVVRAARRSSTLRRQLTDPAALERFHSPRPR